MAAPFEQAFEEFEHLKEEASKYTSESAPQGVREGGEVRAIHYREEEAIFIKASYDRVTVIFSTIFREETDRVFGKVFLQASIAVWLANIELRLTVSRSLLMLVNVRYRMLLRYCTKTNHLWNCRMSQAYRQAKVKTK
jgi:hypothetical protein